MRLLQVLKWSVLGFVGQIVLFFIAESVSEATKDRFLALYGYWITLGEYIFPSGPGGHAMPVGALLGILCGLIVYALIFAVLISYLTRRGTS